jgi:hypothetical protein
MPWNAFSRAPLCFALALAFPAAAGCSKDQDITYASPATVPTASGAGGAGGEGAGGGAPAAIEAPADTWTWVDFPDSRCMNDTPTGIGVNLVPGADKVLIFLEGGNACFNLTSCAVTANKNGYDGEDFAAGADGLAARPIFARGESNVFRDYSFVYVPYCSGDVHAGRRTGADVGGKVRNFRGYDNMTDFLARLVPTFPDAKRVVLSGVSAGGFGAAVNYDQAAKAFVSADVSLLDDSGPPMGKDFVPPCLQQFFVDTWGLGETIGGICPGCIDGEGVFMEPLTGYLASTYSDRTLALITSTHDAQISLFWGFGNDDCANVSGGFPEVPYEPALYEAGVYDLRDRITAADPNFFVYVLDGTDGSDTERHVWLDAPEGVSSNGVLLTDWLTAFEAQSEGLADVPVGP